METRPERMLERLIVISAARRLVGRTGFADNVIARHICPLAGADGDDIAHHVAQSPTGQLRYDSGSNRHVGGCQARRVQYPAIYHRCAGNQRMQWRDGKTVTEGARCPLNIRPTLGYERCAGFEATQIAGAG